MIKDWYWKGLCSRSQAKQTRWRMLYDATQLALRLESFVLVSHDSDSLTWQRWLLGVASFGDWWHGEVYRHFKDDNGIARLSYPKWFSIKLSQVTIHHCRNGSFCSVNWVQSKETFPTTCLLFSWIRLFVYLFLHRKIVISYISIGFIGLSVLFVANLLRLWLGYYYYHYYY